MALISKDTIKWASINKIYWFIVIPFTNKYNWSDYPTAHSVNGYGVKVLSYKEFKDMYFMKGWNKRDGFIYAITKNISLNKLLETIDTSIIEKYKAPKEFELVDIENIVKYFK